MPLKSATPHRVTVGPPELAVPRIAQLGEEWCWAASAQMVLAFYQNPTPTPQQCDLANLLLSFGHCCATPLPEPDCDQPCFASDVEWIYNQHGRSATRLFHVADHARLVHEITQGKPVEVLLVVDIQSSHVVIVKWAGTDAGQPSVHINDPLKSANSVMTYAELLHKGAVDSWVGIG